ncbi:MAG: hypothetical protein ACC682_12550 [Gemmatimonadota bacterium]
MKILGIMAAALVALLVGAKMILAAFSPVLPPDFNRKWDDAFANAYIGASWDIGNQVEFFIEHDRWPASVEEVLSTGSMAKWKENNPRAWRSWVDDRAKEVRFLGVVDGVSRVEYLSLEETDDGRYVPTDRVRCTLTLDADYARAYESWYSTPGARASSSEPAEIARWSRMDCRRTAGVRAWLSWTGLDRYRKPPAERYSALTYAEQAWEREGLNTDAAGRPGWPPSR